MKNFFRGILFTLVLAAVAAGLTNPDLEDFKKQRDLDGKVSETLAQEIFKKEENRGWGQALLKLGLNTLSDNLMEVHACRQNFVLFSKYYITLKSKKEEKKETMIFTAWGFAGKVWPLEEKETVDSVMWKECTRLSL